MKKCSLIFLVLCLLTPLPSMAAEESKELGFWFEARAVSNGSANVIGWYERQLTDLFGFYVLGEQDSDGYRQMYAGPTIKVLPWLQFGVGIGAEHVPDETGPSNSTRTNVFASVDAKKVSAFATFENGGSGPWNRIHAVYNVTGRVSIGAMTETDLGFGPRAELKIWKTVKAWGALLHDRDTGQNTSVLAVNFSF